MSGLPAGEQGFLLCVPSLVLRVHGEKAKHHQVQEGPDYRQARQDVDKAEGHVSGVVLQCMVLLQGHVVSKPDGGKRDEAIIVSVQVTPALVVGERHGPHAQGARTGEEADCHHVRHGDLCLTHSEALLGLVQQVPDKCVDPLPEALEHDQGEWDPQEGVEHAEHFPRVSAGGCMSIA